MLTISDVSERRTLRKRLARAEARYRDLSDIVADAVFTIDLKGIFTSYNQAMEALTGYTGEEFVGRHFSEFVKPQDAEFITGIYNQMYKNGQS